MTEPESSQKITIAEYGKNAILTAQILAHEMGHGLGMEHDFGYNDKGDPIIDANGKTVDRPGKNCTKVDGFMDYSINPKRWSHCSVEDFTKYYNKWHNKKGKVRKRT